MTFAKILSYPIASIKSSHDHPQLSRQDINGSKDGLAGSQSNHARLHSFVICVVGRICARFSVGQCVCHDLNYEHGVMGEFGVDSLVLDCSYCSNLLLIVPLILPNHKSDQR